MIMKEIYDELKRIEQILKENEKTKPGEFANSLRTLKPRLDNLASLWIAEKERETLAAKKKARRGK